MSEREHWPVDLTPAQKKILLDIVTPAARPGDARFRLARASLRLAGTALVSNTEADPALAAAAGEAAAGDLAAADRGLALVADTPGEPERRAHALAARAQLALARLAEREALDHFEAALQALPPEGHEDLRGWLQAEHRLTALQTGGERALALRAWDVERQGRLLALAGSGPDPAGFFSRLTGYLNGLRDLGLSAGAGELLMQTARLADRHAGEYAMAGETGARAALLARAGEARFLLSEMTGDIAALQAALAAYDEVIALSADPTSGIAAAPFRINRARILARLAEKGLAGADAWMQVLDGIDMAFAEWPLAQMPPALGGLALGLQGTALLHREDRPDGDVTALARAAVVQAQALVLLAGADAEIARNDAVTALDRALEAHERLAGPDRAWLLTVSAYRSLIGTPDLKSDPAVWLHGHYRLATALADKAAADGDAEVALRAAALAEIVLNDPLTHTRAPQVWGRRLGRIGKTLLAVPPVQSASDGRLRMAAVRLLEEANRLLPEEDRQDRAEIELALARAHLLQGELGGEEWLERAIESYEAALEVFGKDSHPVFWTRAQSELGQASEKLGLGRQDAEACRRAASAYRAAASGYRVQGAGPAELTATLRAGGASLAAAEMQGRETDWHQALHLLRNASAAARSAGDATLGRHAGLMLERALKGVPTVAGHA